MYYMRKISHYVFNVPFIWQLVVAWAAATLFLLGMFYLFAPALRYISVLPVYQFNLAGFLYNHPFITDVYRYIIWLWYFIPLLYVLNFIFTFIVYLCVNEEILKERNTFMYVKVAMINSMKIFCIQLPVAALICLVVSALDITKTVVILTPFSTEIIRVAIFVVWLVSLVILQTAFALKITLKSSLKYAELLFASYKTIWIIFSILLFALSLGLAKALTNFVPSLTNNDFFSNLYLTGFALAVYVIVIALLLHYLFSYEKPFELESEDL